jgi:hypothetical protein
MRKRLFALTIFTAMLAPLGTASTDSAWNRLLTLVGVWEGTEGDRTTTLTYTLVSGGNALMESMKMPGSEPDMVTIYHRDGDRLVATHYCSFGNQPRMRTAAAPPDGKSIRFEFVDITNLKPGDRHIKHLNVLFEDATHFTQEWTSAEGGKEEATVFKWSRKAK